MNWLEISPDNCSVGRTLALVGEKWTLLVLREVFHGVHRFDELQGHLGVSAALLSDRLRKLTDAGILETRPYREPGQRPRIEYAATRKGWDLFPALVALMQWGDTYAADPDGPLLLLHHEGCDAPARVVVTCDEHGPLRGPGTVAATFGPGARRVDGTTPPLAPPRPLT